MVLAVILLEGKAGSTTSVAGKGKLMNERAAEPKCPVLYESVFERTNMAGAVTVRIAVPRQESDTKWVCLFELMGIGDDRAQRAVGSDSLQCIQVASEYIRRCLLPLNVREAKTKSPPELIFPRHIPIGYGLEFQKYLEAQLDLEVARKELSICDSRKKGKKPR